MTVASAASGASSGSSSSSNTRSAATTVSWIMLAMPLNCMIGIENWRAYWMNAWTSPMAIAWRVTSRPPITATNTNPRLPTNIIVGMMMPLTNWARHAPS